MDPRPYCSQPSVSFDAGRNRIQRLMLTVPIHDLATDATERPCGECKGACNLAHA